MSDYDFKPGGSLKLKGVKDGGVTKKKKKSSKSKEKERSEKARSRLQEEREERPDTPSGSGRDSPAVGGNKTEAEKRFERIQRERLAQRVAKQAGTTHKDRVNEFNTKLEALSEHHDIPKVGPG